MVHTNSADLSAWSIASATRSLGAGVFAFVFTLERLGCDDFEVAADLTVCWYEEKGLAYLDFARLDCIHSTSGVSDAIEADLAAWLEANESDVFVAALRAA